MIWSDGMLMRAACVHVPHVPIKMPILSCRGIISRPSQCHYVHTVHIHPDASLHDKSSPWLFVGLGNPGRKYEGTRHNIGFEMIDSIAQAEGIPLNTIHCKASFGKGYIGNTPVLLAKPQTYMNLSGDSVGPLAAYYRIPLHHVLLIFDDMDLPCGVLRLHPKGGHGGHNGVKSVIHAFKGNRDFARLRIGIGKPPGSMDPKAYVLQVFNLSAREEMNVALQQGVEAVRLLTAEGLIESARHFNLKQKYKYHKV